MDWSCDCVMLVLGLLHMLLSVESEELETACV